MENRDNQNPNPAQGSRKSLAYIAEHVPLQQGQKYPEFGTHSFNIHFLGALCLRLTTRYGIEWRITPVVTEKCSNSPAQTTHFSVLRTTHPDMEPKWQGVAPDLFRPLPHRIREASSQITPTPNESNADAWVAKNQIRVDGLRSNQVMGGRGKNSQDR